MLINPYRFTPVDPYFSSVSLLLHGNGTNGSTTITDSSPSPKTVTVVGNPTISTAQSKFGGSSLYFPGAAVGGPAQRLESADNVAFGFGSGDFTIELWVYAVQQTLGTLCAHTSYSANQGWVLFVYDNTGAVNNLTRKVTFMLNGATFTLVSSVDAFSDNTWTYIAVTKQGTGSNNIKIYSGTAGATSIIAQGTYSASIAPAATPLMVGSTVNNVNWNSSFPYDGFIDDLRITKGVARDVSVVPSSPFPDS